LETLRFQEPDVQAIYGSLAAQPQRLEQSLARWNSHEENRVAEQLAMAPEGVTDDEFFASFVGEPRGAVSILDIDSMI
ncbi:MAG: lipase family protein, partial [Pseudomonas sp.]